MSVKRCVINVLLTVVLIVALAAILCAAASIFESEEAVAGGPEIGRYSLSCAWSGESGSVQCFKIDTATGAVQRAQ